MQSAPGEQGMSSMIQTFLSLFNSAQLAPCWILAGPLETSRKVAMDSAVALLSSSRNGHTMTADRVSRHIHNGCYGNFLWLKKPEEDKEMGVGTVAPLHDFLQKKPLVQGARLVVVDALDVLNRFGANSLLKALEEPPADTFIILLSSHVADVLPTIRSRCQLQTLPSKGDGQEVLSMTALETSCEKLLEQALLGRYQGLVTQCEGLVGGDKTKYNDLAEALFEVLSRKVLSDKQSQLADIWLLGTAFWQDARSTHLDLQHAFMTLLGAIREPELLRQR